MQCKSLIQRDCQMHTCKCNTPFNMLQGKTNITIFPSTKTRLKIINFSVNRVSRRIFLVLNVSPLQCYLIIRVIPTLYTKHVFLKHSPSDYIDLTCLARVYLTCDLAARAARLRDTGRCGSRCRSGKSSGCRRSRRGTSSYVP